LIRRAKTLQDETGVEFCTVTDTEGLVLARSHEPDRFGDSIASQTNVTSALSGKGLTAIEPGTAVRLSIRSGMPVYDDAKQIIGVVSVGYRLDTESFVDSLKALLRCEATVFLGDERISTTVLQEDGTRAIGTTAAQNVSETVLAGNTYSGQAQVVGEAALTKYTPIYGPDSKVLGMLFIGYYLNEREDTIGTFVKIGLLIMLILLVLSTIVILLVTRRITAPIGNMVRASRALAAGDTGISVQLNGKDETAELARAFNEVVENTEKQIRIIEDISAGNLTVEIKPRSENDTMNFALNKMVRNLNVMFGEINASATQVSTGAKQIADGAQSLAQGSTEQAASVEMLSSLIGKMAEKTKASASMAENVENLSKAVKEDAEEGNRKMNEMIAAVNEIDEAGRSIGRIIKTIDDIAFQTNILALNAAVEAARAGQHGKGFAVVAEEVRNLASKSADAAKDTGDMIRNSMEKAELGSRIAGETAESFTKITTDIDETTGLIAEIVEASEEQLSDLTQIDAGIDQVAQVVQQNTATSEESAAASEEMSAQSVLLQDLILRFKLKDAGGARLGSSWSEADARTGIVLPEETDFKF
jgi:methyl-accepting chemotaxis protein